MSAKIQKNSDEIRDALRRLVLSAQDVVKCWSSGDLAGAVNGLEESMDGAQRALASPLVSRNPKGD